jgi:hypothetical protein
VRYSQRLQPFDFSVPAPQAAQILQKLNENSPASSSKNAISFALEVGEGKVCFQETPRHNPKGREVEIQVMYIGLSSYDCRIVSFYQITSHNYTFYSVRARNGLVGSITISYKRLLFRQFFFVVTCNYF